MKVRLRFTGEIKGAAYTWKCLLSWAPWSEIQTNLWHPQQSFMFWKPWISLQRRKSFAKTNKWLSLRVSHKQNSTKTESFSYLLVASHLVFVSLSLMNINTLEMQVKSICVIRALLPYTALCLSLRIILQGSKRMYSLCFMPLEVKSAHGFKDLFKVSHLVNEGKCYKSVWGQGSFPCLHYFHLWNVSLLRRFKLEAMSWVQKTVFTFTKQEMKWAEGSLSVCWEGTE